MRKELDITITEEGRDQGKVFHIREMSASQAEKWAMRALLAVGRSGMEMPEGFVAGGMRNIALIGIQSILRMNFEEAEPLLDEMMTCVSIKPSVTVIRALIEDDIEEVATRIRLRQEVLQLHTGFSVGDIPSEQTPPNPKSPSSNTQTSPQPSVQFSQEALTGPQP